MSITQKEYILRITEVVQYIEEHLEADLSLNILAEQAHYSPFHFHRIFSAIVGETPNEYIIRKRIEKSASIFLKDKESPIADIVFDLGFSSNSAFTKSFKKFYGMSPTAFRKMTDPFSKIGKTERKIGQKSLEIDNYICNINQLKKWMIMNAKFEVKEIPQMPLAYVSHVGNYEEIEGAYGQLMAWAGPKGLLNENSKMLTVYHDDPNVTALSKVRQSASLLLENEVDTQGTINFMTLDPKKCVCGMFEINFSEFEDAWKSVFVWMHENGFDENDKAPFEIYHNDFNTHPEKKCIVEICVPVE
ncbi:AraC family transcriptional regulator [Sediminitomix flava]|uniref:AraC family transcriptional regulator n=1 Tax=Sediminitomix flava TaxID=379075 RepID=A0A315Z819_SEDFL|nr:AraC family transcriptional regulator [Sediminitomix flava]PWJ41102.1 AraC family transcriptional regulator [Sediminitomix flava]